MKTFRVWATYNNYCFIDVKAKSKEEAEEIASQSDGGDFINNDSPLDDGNWHIVNELTKKLKD